MRFGKMVDEIGAFVSPKSLPERNIKHFVEMNKRARIDDGHISFFKYNQIKFIGFLNESAFTSPIGISDKSMDINQSRAQ